LSKQNLVRNGLAALAVAVWALPAAAGPATPSTAASELDSRPYIHPELARKIAKGVTLIPDPRVNYVPNIGIIEGNRAVLVVDTGLGPENGKLAWEYARHVAGKRALYLTTTHFHPEHNSGAQSFHPDARIILNEAQARELSSKGPAYIKMFSGFGPDIAAALANTKLVTPDQTYTYETTLDLGGRTVVLREMPAHTLGDQVIFVPDVKVLFTGDLIENRFFPIFPDGDSDGARWIEVTKALAALKPIVVVTGHGAVGNASLVRTTGQYLQHVRDAVATGVSKGLSQEELTHSLTQQLHALHPDWDNAVFIPYEIAIFYAQATHSPARLPDLQTELQRPAQ